MKIFVSILTACLVILSSCSKADTPSISKTEAIAIFKNLKRIQPTNVAISTINGVEKIVCIAKKNGPEDNPYSDKYLVYVLSKFANTWRVESEKEIINLEFETISFDGFDFEVAIIDNRAYLYFVYVTGPVGNAVSYANYNFTLVSLSDFTISELVYQELHLSDERDFINLEDFKDKPIILKYLEERAAKSKFVYKPTKEDLDMDNPKNYEKRWEIDNPNISTIWDGNSAINNTLKVTYYTKNIIPKEMPSIFSKKENKKYIIFALFRSDILGYDKLKKKYFPIWVESCSHGCNKDIEFIGNDKLKIIYSESQGETIVVDLLSMNFEIYKR